MLQHIARELGRTETHRHDSVADNELLSTMQFDRGLRALRRRLERIGQFAVEGYSGTKISDLQRMAARAQPLEQWLRQEFHVTHIDAWELNGWPLSEVARATARMAMLLAAVSRLVGARQIPAAVAINKMAGVLAPAESDPAVAISKGASLVLGLAPELFAAWFLLWSLALRDRPLKYSPLL
jgi:hypothetical protein